MTTYLTTYGAKIEKLGMKKVIRNKYIFHLPAKDSTKGVIEKWMGKHL